MPTPRQRSEISKQVARNLVGDRADDVNAWIFGTIVLEVGDLSPVFHVNLSTGKTVVAASVLDAPLALGALVWVVQRDQFQYLIIAEA